MNRAQSAASRKDRILQSPQFRQGRFHNISVTPVQTKEFSVLKLLRDQFNPPPDKNPVQALPMVRTDVNRNKAEPMIVWFGHSSYFIRLHDVSILVDPVFSGRVSPVSFFGKSYPGTDSFTADDFTAVDAVIITHDHYDHLDHSTIIKLHRKTERFITPLGVGARLEGWGIEPERITELDWWERTSFKSLTLAAAPARHFSGRSLRRNTTLWSSFILTSERFNLYLGGDSGYDDHFKSIGDKYGPFDLALLECGQYNTMWPLIHMMPEETVQAAIDLQAHMLMPIHWGKFSLALHPWKEPVERVLKAARKHQVPVTTPRIGEPVLLGKSYPADRWWEGL